MGKITLLLVLGVIASIGLIVPNSAFAGGPPMGGFQGAFDPSNWTFFTQGNGFVDTDGAPESIMLVGSDESETCNSNEEEDDFCPTDFTIPITQNGYVKFFWEYETDDGPNFDRAGYLINGVFFELTDPDGDTEQSGFVVVPINQGQVFGFRLDATDDCCGVGAFTEIFDFMFIPENEGAYVSGSDSSGDNLDSGSIGLADFDSGDVIQIGEQIIEGGLSGLTFDSNGNLFGSSVDGCCSQSELYQIDPNTGEATLIGDIEIPAVSEGSSGELKIRDLATQPGTDVIFGLGQVVEGDSFGCDSSSPGNSLFTIDSSDASADCIGIIDISEGKVGGIAFAPDGTLYAIGGGGCFNDDDEDCTNFLASFNPDDASFAGFVLFGVEDFLDGLGVRPSDGGFFGTATDFDSVHSIDLETGDTPTVAGIGEAMADITFFPFNVPSVPLTKGGEIHRGDPTLGVQRNGILVQSDGFCFDLFCLDVFDYFNHLPIQQVNSGSTHTISLTAYCPSGSNRCNYASVGAAPPGTDINSVEWNLVLKRIGITNDWELIENDQNDMLGNVVGTVQVIDASRIQYSFSIQFTTPASIGTVDGNAQAPEDNMIIVTEIRDSNGGSNRNIFNEGVFVNDIYAYPLIDESYMPPMEVESLCLNEDPTKRYTCAFDKVRELTIKQAEEKLQEIYKNHNYQSEQ